MKKQNTNRAMNFSYALRTTLLASCLAVFTLASTALAGDDGNKQTKIFPPDGKTYGKTYGQLAGAWWDWAVNQPPDTNPILDETGAFCAVGQDEDYGQGGKIFFLAGNFGGETVRHCTVPEGKALFFPVINGLWIAPEEGDNEACRQAVNEFLGFPAEIACTIDGVPVEDLRAYRAQSPPGGSPFHIRSGGLLEWLAPDFYVPRDYLPGTVADGYWLLVELGSGKEHVIEFSGKSANPDNPFELSVKYMLTVAGDGEQWCVDFHTPAALQPAPPLLQVHNWIGELAAEGALVPGDTPGVTTASSRFGPAGCPWHTNGKMHMKIKGEAGMTYNLEASTNLVDWQAICVVHPDEEGNCGYEDAMAGKHPSRFYRVTKP